MIFSTLSLADLGSFSQLATTSVKPVGLSSSQPNGNRLVRLSATDNGGIIDVFNKTGERLNLGYD